MSTVELVFTVLDRLSKLGKAALAAARAGDDKAVDDILPDPDDYPDEHVYHRLKNQADQDYGPPSSSR